MQEDIRHYIIEFKSCVRSWSCMTCCPVCYPPIQTGSIIRWNYAVAGCANTIVIQFYINLHFRGSQCFKPTQADSSWEYRFCRKFYFTQKVSSRRCSYINVIGTLFYYINYTPFKLFTHNYFRVKYSNHFWFSISKCI